MPNGTNEPKFTPGPWRVTYTNTFEGFQGLGIIGSVVNITIGNQNFPLGVSGIQCSEEVERYYKTAIANAHLIAQTPDLLKYSEEVAMFLKFMLSRDLLPEPYNESAQAMIEKWEELRRKVIGEK